MKRRGLHLDHSTINRHLKKYDPTISDKQFSTQWFVERSTTNVEGNTKHVTVLVDAKGEVIDFFMSEKTGFYLARDFFKELF